MLETKKVSYTNGYNYKLVPFIKLAGKWLAELGFNIGDTIHVVKDKDIIILMKADQDIMDLKEQLSK